jgi:hypothetical protein
MRQLLLECFQRREPSLRHFLDRTHIYDPIVKELIQLEHIFLYESLIFMHGVSSEWAREGLESACVLEEVNYLAFGLLQSDLGGAHLVHEARLSVGACAPVIHHCQFFIRAVDNKFGAQNSFIQILAISDYYCNFNNAKLFEI